MPQWGAGPYRGMNAWDVVGALAPPVITGAASLIGQERANIANVGLSREQMAFQERMSSTAWQRAVDDMKLAGINPMLAYQQGGASSPGGQTARMEDVLGPAASSAMAMMRMRKELKLMDAQRFKVEKDAYKSMMEGSLVNTQNQILGAGVRAGTQITPYGVIQRQLDTSLRKQQIQLTAAQRRALEYSPFITRFTGTGAPRRFFETGIKFRDRYRRR